MKVNDFIFRFPTFCNDGVCRVRVFASGAGEVVAVFTDFGAKSSGVTNFVKVIRAKLIREGFLVKDAKIIEHYEATDFRPATFDEVTFGERTSWLSLDEKDVLLRLHCNDEEFDTPTLKSQRLSAEVERIRNEISPYLDGPRRESAAITQRRLEIHKGQVSKGELQELIDLGSNEQTLQRFLKSDLSLIAEVYAQPEDEYIAFAEFPVGDGFVDIALFTGRSRMEVILIELKGADYDLMNKDSYGNFSQKFYESTKQIQRRIGVIYDDGLNKFRDQVHSIREQVIGGCELYRSFIGPRPKLDVDPRKGVIVRCVVIGGRTRDDLRESHDRHNFERTFSLPIKVETWDSWIKKLRRL